MAEEAQENQEAKVRKALEKRYRALQLEQQKKEVAKRFLTPEAYERLMNVRASNYELYSKVIDLIIAMAQSNRITSKITEAQLKDLLAKLTYRPEPKIEFKHK